MLVAKRPQRLQKFDRRRVESAFALNRLDNNGGDIAGCDIDLEQVVDRFQRILYRYPVILDRERRVINLGRERAKQVLVGRYLSGQSHCQHGSAMKTTIEGDYAAASGMRARDFNRVFDRFGAGGDKNRLFLRFAGRQFVELLGEPNRCVVRGYHDTGMTEPVELLGDRGGDFRVAMTCRAYGDTGAEVDITPAFYVPDFGTRCALDKHGCNIALATRYGIVLAGLPVFVRHVCGFVRGYIYCAH